MRDKIVIEITSVSDCADVTTAQLAGVTSLDFLDDGIKSLQPGDFSGLTALNTLYLDDNEFTSLPDNVFSGLTALDELRLNDNELTSLPARVFSGLTALNTLHLDYNELSSLPDGVFSDLTALERLKLDGNELTSLPDNVFSGLTNLIELRLEGNAVDPLPLAVTLEKNPDAAEIRAVVLTAAPFEVVLSVNVVNGSLAGGAATITVPAGARESAWVGVTRTADTTGAVTADIDLTTPAEPAHLRHGLRLRRVRERPAADGAFGQRGAGVQLTGDVRRGGEPDRGGHGAGDRQRHGRRRHGATRSPAGRTRRSSRSGRRTGR